MNIQETGASLLTAITIRELSTDSQDYGILRGTAKSKETLTKIISLVCNQDIQARLISAAGGDIEREHIIICSEEIGDSYPNSIHPNFAMRCNQTMLWLEPEVETFPNSGIAKYNPEYAQAKQEAIISVNPESIIGYYAPILIQEVEGVIYWQVSRRFDLTKAEVGMRLIAR